MKKAFESPINVSVGNIESIRINKRDRVKYEISYLDKNGKEHKSWSNWMRDNGHKAGDSIPVQSLSIPGTFGFCSILLEVEGIAQQHAETYVATMVVLAIGIGVIGYLVGKSREE